MPWVFCTTRFWFYHRFSSWLTYFAYEAKKSLSKLSNRRSYIMIAYLYFRLDFMCYYSVFVFCIGMLSWEKSSVESIDFVDNIWNVVSGSLHLLLKAIYLFGFGVGLFINEASVILGTTL
ncbi:hypothetical protein Bca101_074241 [Brassica carinata]